MRCPVLVGLVLATPLAASAYGQDGLPTLHLSQLHVAHPEGGQIEEFTRMGRLELTFTEDDTAFLVENGGVYFNFAVYNNVSNGVEWVVQNAYFSYADLPRLVGARPGFEFGIGPIDATGVAWDFTFHSFSLTDAPLNEPIHTHISGQYPQLALHGVCGPDWGASAPNTPVYESIGAFVSPLGGGPYKIGRHAVAFPDLPSIDEDRGECVPSAVARSLAFLVELNGDYLPITPQTLKDWLAQAMDTNVGGWDTALSDVVPGKCAIVEAFGYPICTLIVPGWNGVTRDMATQLLNAGCDIEVFLDGHCAMLTEIVTDSNGAGVISTVDDPHPGDGEAQNAARIYGVNPDGSVIGGGTVDYFLFECWGESCGCP